MEGETEKQIDWYTIGYTKRIAVEMKSTVVNTQYPTQDKYTPKDERDYIRGYSTAGNDILNGLVGPSNYIMD